VVLLGFVGLIALCLRNDNQKVAAR
jgi:hypothetical protein